MSEFSRAYSEQAFRVKLGLIAGLQDLVAAAQRIHALLRDPATPLWVKAACVAALGYLIVPTDAVADFVPALGYGDDLTVLSAAVAAIVARWERAPSQD